MTRKVPITYWGGPNDGQRTTSILPLPETVHLTSGGLGPDGPIGSVYQYASTFDRPARRERHVHVYVFVGWLNPW